MNMKFYAIPILSLAMSLLGATTVQAQVAAPPANNPVDTTETPELIAKEQKILSDNALAAAAWLQLIDQGKYGESWDTAATQLRTVITKDQWIKKNEKLRKPYGNVISRKMLQQQLKQNPKDMTPGYYMVLVYQSSFSSHPQVSELLTMFFENDGKWRTVTYDAAFPSNGR